jgi:hypothetical protein
MIRLETRPLEVRQNEHGRSYGQKDFVVDNAKFFLSNRRFMGVTGPGSDATEATDTGADAGHNAANAGYNAAD